MLKVITAFLCLLAFATSADARQRHRGQGLICGAYQMAHYGVGSRLALDWAKMFQHTSAPAPEVVVVQRRAGRDSAGHPGGHVSRIVSVISACRAIVSDPRGTYERDICKNLVALVIPGARSQVSSIEPDHRPPGKHPSRTKSKPKAPTQYATFDRHAVF